MVEPKEWEQKREAMHIPRRSAQDGALPFVSAGGNSEFTFKSVDLDVDVADVIYFKVLLISSHIINARRCIPYLDLVYTHSNSNIHPIDLGIVDTICDMCILRS